MGCVRTWVAWVRELRGLRVGPKCFCVGSKNFYVGIAWVQKFFAWVKNFFAWVVFYVGLFLKHFYYQIRVKERSFNDITPPINVYKTRKAKMVGKDTQRIMRLALLHIVCLVFCLL